MADWILLSTSRSTCRVGVCDGAAQVKTSVVFSGLSWTVINSNLPDQFLYEEMKLKKFELFMPF